MKTIEAKIVVLGAQGVGKTSMVVRYIGKMFSHHISPTIGASFFTCKINIEDTRVKLQVWDTAGQERFRSMAPMYYRNANAALLVFDITQYDSFLSVKSWVKELQRNVDEPMVLSVVGNKIDLSDGRKVSKEEASAYAESIGARYFESSALQDEELQRNVDEPMVLSVVGNKIDLSDGRKVSKEEASAYAESIGARYFESSALQDEGIEEVFLNTAVGLIRLCEDSSCSSLRVYDSSERMSPRTNVFHDPASPPSPPTVTQPVVHTDVPFVPAQAEVERSPFCC